MSLWFRHGIFAREAGGNGAKLAAIPLGNLAIRATVVLRPEFAFLAQCLV